MGYFILKSNFQILKQHDYFTYSQTGAIIFENKQKYKQFLFHLYTFQVLLDDYGRQQDQHAYNVKHASKAWQRWKMLFLSPSTFTTLSLDLEIEMPARKWN